jgi:hypothetical protein
MAAVAAGVDCSPLLEQKFRRYGECGVLGHDFTRAFELPTLYRIPMIKNAPEPILARDCVSAWGIAPFRGTAVYKGSFPPRVPQVLCAGAHTPQFTCRRLGTWSVFSPCRSAAIFPVTRWGAAIEGN